MALTAERTQDPAAPDPAEAGVDELTRIFSQDDIRMLVDLLKLTLATTEHGGEHH